mgnify:CR=1 FL=1
MQIQSLLARMFIAHEKGVQTAVNAYLIHTGEHLVLVDTGAASCFGPTLGQVQANLKDASSRKNIVLAATTTVVLRPDVALTKTQTMNIAGRTLEVHVTTDAVTHLDAPTTLGQCGIP